ncbi:TPA: YeiH family protein [Streptococcus pyogenes]|uniref:YeiH family protein n=1 Tax=Streptococcus pyogenes TaxID=1314 RepID=UPI0004D1031A|nr:YeiH family protein [Streptococcus pyogenes]HER4566058.1 YeiH family putative sulfate export transporter [Streptococcus pyogenes NGAS629]HER4575022.1 YeiH family putative sulfate export transporter [Streptococcus pyogenes NGAS643]HER4578459.1 YeiH family putative sulfate export transporter [Streptococcus pyogenes NGAS633]HER4583539.1 YeiH family putative sulfate export transporter [Streptococcus pyogenes NGAS655]HER4604207.1 YeiH family putative sulfate export transporter [Streptococcus pyo
MSTNLRKLPGLLLCLLLALPAWCLGRLFPIIGAPVFAILLGMLLALFYEHRDKTKEGISFTSKYILQTAVVLLGFGLNLTQVMAVGMQSLPIIISTIAAALLVAYGLQKWLRLDVNTATLVGVGSSICGGSAIAATAPVIKAKDDEVAKAISVIFLFNMLAALLFPSLGQLLGLSNEGFAIFAGTAVNDTSSVTATATAWDALHHSNTLDGATIVKLTRTLAILPITLGLSLYRAKKEHDIVTEEGFSLRKLFPRFILFFLLASLITTLMTSFGVSADVFHSLKTLSKFFIVMAMAAIGLNTNLVKLIETGGQAILLGAICWVAITLVSLAMQLSLGIW